MTDLSTLNKAAAAMSAIAGLLALTRPELMVRASGRPMRPERFYAGMYAARAVPLGVAAALVVGRPQEHQGALFATLAAAQLGDAALGVRTRQPAMVALPIAAAVVHGLAAYRELARSRIAE